MHGGQEHVITPDQAGSLHGLFTERVRRTPEAVAYRFFDAAHNQWVSLTWAQVRDEVGRWQAALQREGLQPGDRVGIMLRNCPQWMMFDQAALSLGLVVVPLYTVDRPDNVAYIAEDAGIKVLLFENGDQWLGLSGVSKQMTAVQRFVCLRPVAARGEERLISVDKWLPERAALQAEVRPDRHALATIMYTSGTTGRPKGVMLSHEGILWNAYASMDVFAVRQDDVFLSFLPLSHAFERTLGYYLTVMTGAQVAFARSISSLSEDLRTIRPTVLIAVPRVFERIYQAIQTRLHESSGFRQKFFRFAVGIGWARFLHQQGRGPWILDFLLWPLLQRMVAQKILAHLGGNLRVAVSGGAALPFEIAQTFLGLGLPLVQGYGLTETGPVVSGNHLERNDPASVGEAIPGVEVRLGEQGALLVRGPSNMLGYWNNPAATAAMIDAEGWLNTGDTARITNTGHIYITGRLKEVIVMSNGEKIPPGDMEQAILRDRLFEQVMVYGEGRPYLVVLATVNPDVWVKLAQDLGVRADMPESLHDLRVERAALGRVAAQIREFPGYAKVRRVLLLDEHWSIENGLLTPTLKLKRAQVVAKYAERIENLYQGH